jgi:hypothetical protein
MIWTLRPAVAPVIAVWRGVAVIVIIRRGVAVGAHLRSAFADRIASAGRQIAVLAVEIDSVETAIYAGYELPPDNLDWMRGTGRILVGGHVVGEYPLTVNISASASGPCNLPDIDALRVSALCNQFPIMPRREMGI